MQLRKALMALENPLKPPPDPKLGRSEAHACLAFWKVLVFPDEEPEPPKPPGAPDGEVGTVTPCCFRQERYALKLADDPDVGVLPDAVLQPATSSVARPATVAVQGKRPNPVNLRCRLGTILGHTALTSSIKVARPCSSPLDTPVIAKMLAPMDDQNLSASFELAHKRAVREPLGDRGTDQRTSSLARLGWVPGWTRMGA
jgi:hypothetical protein